VVGRLADGSLAFSVSETVEQPNLSAFHPKDEQREDRIGGHAAVKTSWGLLRQPLLLSKTRS